MVIAVQKGLENIKEMLRENGFEVVTFGEYNYPIDAILYTGYGINSSYLSSNNIPSLISGDMAFGLEGIGRRTSYGVLMVNIEGKTLDEIVSMLRKRVYSNLF